MEETKENLEPEILTDKQDDEQNQDAKDEHDKSEELEFMCKICDVVYLSKEKYDCHVASVFHEVNMNRKKNEYNPRVNRWRETDRDRGLPRRPAPSSGYKTRNNWSASNQQRGHNHDNLDYHHNNDNTGHSEHGTWDTEMGDRPPHPSSMYDHDNWYPEQAPNYGQNWNSIHVPSILGAYPGIQDKPWCTDNPESDAYFSFSGNYSGGAGAPQRYPPYQSALTRQHGRHGSWRPDNQPGGWTNPRKNSTDWDDEGKGKHLESGDNLDETGHLKDLQRRRTESQSDDPDSEHKDSHTHELSLKASNIIDAILKGEAPPKDVPTPASSLSSPSASSTTSATSKPTSKKADKSNEDILLKAEKLCESFRKQRQQLKLRQDLIDSYHETKTSCSISSSSVSSFATNKSSPRLKAKANNKPVRNTPSSPHIEKTGPKKKKVPTATLR